METHSRNTAHTQPTRLQSVLLALFNADLRSEHKPEHLPRVYRQLLDCIDLTIRGGRHELCIYIDSSAALWYASAWLG
jgi:hypothetical protein